MYRAFVKACSADKSVTKSEHDSKDAEVKDSDVDETVYKAIKQLWAAADKQCGDQKTERSRDNSEIYNDLGWIIIRVFVSSTFNDFFNEREILVKKVFPELREWCSELGMKFVECDLRWGIPKDTPTGDTILICLDEIERCREENKDLPFFIGLIGERYGWMPKEGEVPIEAREKYGWIDGASITFNEILSGAYRDKNPNAAFFLREEAICESIPEPFYQRFVETEALPRHHLKVMKQKIKERFQDQVYSYSCKFQEISADTGREQVRFTEMDDFAERVTQFLKKAIARTYPSVNGISSLNENSFSVLEERLQRLFVLDKAKSLVGRQAELTLLKDFIDQRGNTNLETTEGSDSKMRKAESWDLRDNDSKVCVVQGHSGLGKTALLCRLVDDLVRKNMNIFYHMVGSTPSSIRVETVLERLLNALESESLLKEEAEDDKSGEQSQPELVKLQNRLAKALSAFREASDKHLVICIDALDQLESRETLGHLSWLPPTLPCNIRCVVSTSLHLPTSARLHEYPVLKLNLLPLPEEELQLIMTRYLGNFSKVETIIKDTGADSPLWVMLMAEELRIFGDFRLMVKRINDFPCSLDEFMVQVLERLIREDNEHGVIKKILCLMACSRSEGLPSQHLQQLCGDVKAKEELPLMYWALARRTLKPYLRVSMALNDTITFSHQAVFKAVNSLLLSTQASRQEWYILLADFYQTWCTDVREKVDSLPHYLKQANLKKRLADFITKDKDSFQIMSPWSRSDFLRSIRCQGLADAVMPHTAPVLMCHSCAIFSKFNPACPWPTKDCCMLCSNYCGPRGGFKPIPARACMVHAERRALNRYKCLKCHAVVQEKPNVPGGLMTPIPAILCTHCGFGNNGRRCAHLAV